jgi:DNA-binding NarL/FixJ family response regulator
LEDIGFNIVGIASTGEDAIKQTSETNPDLVLMNIRLKGDLDGIETAQTISDVYDIPFIYLTGYFDNKSLERALITKPHGYIIKPFNDGEIQNAIKLALINHQKSKD